MSTLSAARADLVRRGVRRAIRCLARGLVAAVLVAQVGCNSTRSCRPGTLFVTLRLGSFSAADSVTMTVAVAGSSSKQTRLPLTGAASGGIEVTFPGGYPNGKSVTVTARLDKNAMPLATRAASIVLGSGCGALEVDFRGDDGAVGESPVGTGGVGMGGGGDQGGGGVSGATGGAGGGSGSGGGGRGGDTGGTGTGGLGGRGGSAAAGGGGNGGVGTGGVGTGGRGGSPDGGVDSGCVSLGVAESCFNNIDDDCNGLTDCADPACQQPAQCVALDPALGPIGTSVAPTAPCPAEASFAKSLMNGIAASGCNGCSCGVGPGLTCRADIYEYDTPAQCADPNQLGTLVHTLTSAEGCFTPNWVMPIGTIYGVGTTVFQGTPTGMCLPGGMATKGAPIWNSATKFCSVPAVGGGCGPGAACVPRGVVATRACVLQTGARACPAGTTTSSWFTGFSDTRACGACTCGPPAGGDCGPMIIGVGSDFSCQMPPLNGYLRNASRTCFSGTGVYSPGLQFAGTPVAPTCQSTVAQSGALTASGPQTLCCQ